MKSNKDIMKNNETPWLKDDGMLKTDEEIKTISKAWDLKTWDNYLKETVELPLVEYNLIDEEENKAALLPHDFSLAEFFYEVTDVYKEYPTLIRLIKSVITHFQTLEFYIIDKIYFEYYSERKLEKILNISRKKIHKHKLIGIEILTNAFAIAYRKEADDLRQEVFNLLKTYNFAPFAPPYNK